MSAARSSPAPAPTSYANTPTRSVSVRGVEFVYRQLGPDDGVPLILLNHLAAVLDNWDPRVVDGLAARRRVITYDNRGVGASGGSTPDTIEAMARDTVLFIKALGYDQVDLLGLSMGGFVAQVIAVQEPRLVRKVVLAGTGPAGGPGIDKVTRLTIKDTLRAVLTRKDPKQYLFFPDTAVGRRAAHAFLDRLKERTDGRDKAISISSFRAQLKAIHRWGLQAPADLSRIRQPVLVVNGESDRMVPSENTLDLAARLPRSELEPLYPGAGHGGIFQYHDTFVPRALAFLAA
ncbi:MULTISPECIES: alpha/beta hydrolase [unclassified Streptomyces]|uniref:alpha/beta fold hydrolase n=1 Tax=unclassified Streptomyces TaxID=2593676 RepID=UPI0006FB7881|nr:MULTISPECIES: alpha/beta hydrolase [unclassified Streptomyces]KQX48051.1 alpha/beta hydrolase [Streptomyces sp. Root1304]KRA82443.1 alpha/beta hydrolase [Streptomyces sp. Root66D1]